MMKAAWQNIKQTARLMRAAGLRSVEDPLLYKKTVRIEVHSRGLAIANCVGATLQAVDFVTMASWKESVEYLAQLLVDRAASYRGSCVVLSLWPDRGQWRPVPIGSEAYKSLSDLEMTLRYSPPKAIVEAGEFFSIVSTKDTGQAFVFTFEARHLSNVLEKMINVYVFAGPVMARSIFGEVLDGTVGDYTLCLYDGSLIHYLVVAEGQIISARSDLAEEVDPKKLGGSLSQTGQMASGRSDLNEEGDSKTPGSSPSHARMNLFMAMAKPSAELLGIVKSQNIKRIYDMTNLLQEHPLPKEWEARLDGSMFPISLFYNGAKFA